ncbi:gliding motility protein GldN [Flavihumibacter petaseus]|uniref:Gliding motility-associated protein GldN n=1 Tax=Flavihumibacter petaseus NBRC 106054 TaxID=1220578 RepID=A0A0E9N6Z7_9BACT|nr:gliding motility protein GldN [Flavihumibacter petaseus]GAO45120.1 gliding motility-associated protein GldN [Flavihumibacter petaseus NBRC 106054]
MKNRIIQLCLVVAAMGLFVSTADAQAKKSRTAKKRTTAKKTSTNKSKSGNAAALTQAPAVQDTVPLVAPEPTFDLGPVRKSLRNDNAIERNLVKERIPLTYEHIREDDAVYRQRLWREIDIHEKMNLPFMYKADDDNGNQRFINILLNSLKSGELTAFNPIDDRFTTPITIGEIAKQLVGEPQTIQIPDWIQDPDGSKGIMKDSIIVNEFNPENIEKYWIKEEVVFDKESSRLHVRILGIAPLKTIKNADGSLRDVTPLFWVYYPDMRPLLARYEAYNGKNFGARMSWEELFESRMFSSRIIKSTIDNPSDAFIMTYIKDPILRLLEGENIKDKIFNYEQDLWSY